MDQPEFHCAAGTDVRLYIRCCLSKAARVSASTTASNTRCFDRRILWLPVISAQLCALRRRSIAVCLRSYEAADADDAGRNRSHRAEKWHRHRHRHRDRLAGLLAGALVFPGLQEGRLLLADRAHERANYNWLDG